MTLSNIIKNSALFIVLTFSFYIEASEKALLEIFSAGERKQYTRVQLLQLPQYSINTKLPWTDESHTYSGPRLEDVLQLAKVKGHWLKLDALDFYNVSLNFNKIKKFNPILALERDKKQLTVRNKGPLWLILPVDDHAELKAAIYNDFMVWHLIKIGVQDKEPK